jgi:hypothetical protein
VTNLQQSLIRCQMLLTRSQQSLPSLLPSSLSIRFPPLSSARSLTNLQLSLMGPRLSSLSPLRLLTNYPLSLRSSLPISRLSLPSQL